MKKALTRGEKWLFASPLLFLVIAAVAWQRQKSTLILKLPDASYAKLLEFSPDSKRLVVSYQALITAQMTSRVYDLETRSVVCELADPPSLDTRMANRRSIDYFYRWLAWSRDGKQIVGSSSVFKFRKIAIWDAENGTVQADYPDLRTGLGYPNDGMFRFSDDGKSLVGSGKLPVTYNMVSGAVSSKQSTTNHTTNHTGDSQSGRAGIVADFDTRARSFQVVDSKTKRVLWEPKISMFPQWKWYGDILCVLDDDTYSSGLNKGENRLLLWDSKKRQQLPSPPIFFGAKIADFCFIPDKQSLAYYHGITTYKLDKVMVENTRGELVVWNYRSNRVQWSVATKIALEGLQPSPDGKWLAVMRMRGPYPPLFVYDQRGQLRFECDSSNHIARWSPDSKQLAVVTGEFGAKGRPLTTRIEIQRFED